jgi:hypothetical protein
MELLRQREICGRRRARPLIGDEGGRARGGGTHLRVGHRATLVGGGSGVAVCGDGTHHEHRAGESRD